jgi:Kef-type K+ transport system membrane component KefB
MKITRNDFLFCLAIVFSIWFGWFGLIWSYNAALFIAYPFGLLSFSLWMIIRKDGKKRNKIIPVILISGLMLSLGVLIYLLKYD